VTARVSRFLAGGSLGALILLCLAWELWLAPLRPGGSWMALKALPLLFPVRGVLRGTIYTFQWTLLLVPAYFAEGVVRAWSERAPPRRARLSRDDFRARLFYERDTLRAHVKAGSLTASCLQTETA
jgi:uncharacterized membrane protein